MGNEILLYLPNQIGYVRLLLLFVSLLLYEHPLVFLVLYCVSAILDGVDGMVARKYNQTSAFGAWLDVVIDLASRGALWCFLSKWGYFMMLLEWLTFLSTHVRGANWKIPEEQFPTICKMVMAKGFKTPLGFYSITGIFVLPIWLYVMASGLCEEDYLGLSLHLQYVVLVILIGGRALAMTAELFYIQQHIKHLLDEPVASLSQPNQVKH